MPENSIVQYEQVADWISSDDPDLQPPDVSDLGSLDAWAGDEGRLPLLHVWACVEWIPALGSRASHLIEGGADLEARVDVTFGRGATALHVTAREGSARHVDTLIKLGANVDALTKEGNTPLVLASTEVAEQGARVKHLLDGGANVRHRNEHGHTARDAAIRFLKTLSSISRDGQAQAVLGAADDPSRLSSLVARIEMESRESETSSVSTQDSVASLVLQQAYALLYLSAALKR